MPTLGHKRLQLMAIKPMILPLEKKLVCLENVNNLGLSGYTNPQNDKIILLYVPQARIYLDRWLYHTKQVTFQGFVYKPDTVCDMAKMCQAIKTKKTLISARTWKLVTQNATNNLCIISTLFVNSKVWTNRFSK